MVSDSYRAAAPSILATSWPASVDVPDALHTWLARCTAFDPAARYPTAAACARALSSIDVQDQQGTGSGWEAAAATIGFDTFVLDLDEDLADTTPSVAAELPLAPLPARAPLHVPVTLPAVSLRHGFPEVVVWPHQAAAQSLWDALRQVEEAGRPATVRLGGGTESDRAALRAWLGRNAGARGWWWVPLHERQGLASASRSWLDAEKLAGLDLRRQLAWRLQAHVDDAWIAALAEGLAHGDGLDTALATLRTVGSLRPLVLTVAGQRPPEVDELLARASSLQVPLLLVAPPDHGADDDTTTTATLTPPPRPVLVTLLQSAAGLRGELEIGRAHV